MSLVVEDGTGDANAESFCSVAAADTRHSNFGNTGWTGTTADKEQALRRATAHMEQLYRARWKGCRKTITQALSWPRYGACADGYAVASDIVPAEIINACADLALKALTETLAPDLERSVIREKTGPIETEFDRASPQSKRRPAIDMMLAPYLKASGATLVRA